MSIPNSCERKINNLKVSELRCELERRNLDKNGVKSVLLERLKTALLEEGVDAEEYDFYETPTKGSHQGKKNISIASVSGLEDGEINETVPEPKPSLLLQNAPEIEVNLLSPKPQKKNTEIYNHRSSQEKGSEVITLHDEAMETEEPKMCEDTSLVQDQIICNENVPKSNAIRVKNDDCKNEALGTSFNKSSNGTQYLGFHGNVVQNEAIGTNIGQEHEEKVNNEETLQISIDDEERLPEDLMDPPNKPKMDVAHDPERKMSIEQAIQKKHQSLNINQSPPKPTAAGSSCVSKDKGLLVKSEKGSNLLKPQTSEAIVVGFYKDVKSAEKVEKPKAAVPVGTSLCITGLPTTTKAADLKNIFSKQGKVLSVKIVKSIKQTPGKCYGFVTMANSKDAAKAIQNLHRTEVNGRIISVEKSNQAEPLSLIKKAEAKIVNVKLKKPVLKKEVTKPVTVTVPTPISNMEDSMKPAEAGNLTESTKLKDDKKTENKEKPSSVRESKDKDSKHASTHSHACTKQRMHHTSSKKRLPQRSYGTNRPKFGSSTHQRKPGQSFHERAREDRDRTRERAKERDRRNEDRKRALEVSRHRQIERKHREEALELAREKEKLRIERELLQRERSEMLKLERERQKLEREMLERERAELRRQEELGLHMHKMQRPLILDSMWSDQNRMSTHQIESPSFVHGPKIHSSVLQRGSRYDYTSKSANEAYSHRTAGLLDSSSSSKYPERIGLNMRSGRQLTQQRSVNQTSISMRVGRQVQSRSLNRTSTSSSRGRQQIQSRSPNQFQSRGTSRHSTKIEQKSTNRQNFEPSFTERNPGNPRYADRNQIQPRSTDRHQIQQRTIDREQFQPRSADRHQIQSRSTNQFQTQPRVMDRSFRSRPAGQNPYRGSEHTSITIQGGDSNSSVRVQQRQVFTKPDYQGSTSRRSVTSRSRQDWKTDRRPLERPEQAKERRQPNFY